MWSLEKTINMQITLTFNNKVSSTFHELKTDLSNFDKLIIRLCKKAGVGQDKLIEIKINII